MPFTQEQIDDIDAAIAENLVNGVKSVTTDGLTVVGHSLQEQMQAREEMKGPPTFGFASRRLDSPGGWGDR